MRPPSPTKLSLDLLEATGYEAQEVELWVRGTNKRRDLFGAIDILGAHPGDRQILGVQATSSNNHAARLDKALDELRIKTWILAGGVFEVWSWSLKGPAGTEKLWTVGRQALAVHHNGELFALPRTFYAPDRGQ